MPIDSKREQARRLSHHAYVDCHACALQKRPREKGIATRALTRSLMQKAENLNVGFRGLRQRSPVAFLVRHARCPI
jgi:hypothetical protein